MRKGKGGEARGEENLTVVLELRGIATGISVRGGRRKRSKEKGKLTRVRVRSKSKIFQYAVRSTPRFLRCTVGF
jgi:hypothetical protein